MPSTTKNMKFAIRWRAPTYEESSRHGLSASFFCEGQGFSTEDVWMIARLQPGQTVELEGSSGVEVTRES
ncbi:hypothetical protein BJL96_27805 [Burkholderia cenocepacia]|nr:hypothetical protein [Burkholderia cenocepacia]